MSRLNAQKSAFYEEIFQKNFELVEELMAKYSRNLQSTKLQKQEVRNLSNKQKQCLKVFFERVGLEKKQTKLENIYSELNSKIKRLDNQFTESDKKQKKSQSENLIEEKKIVQLFTVWYEQSQKIKKKDKQMKQQIKNIENDCIKHIERALGQQRQDIESHKDLTIKYQVSKLVNQKMFDLKQWSEEKLNQLNKLLETSNNICKEQIQKKVASCENQIVGVFQQQKQNFKQVSLKLSQIKDKITTIILESEQNFANKAQTKKCFILLQKRIQRIDLLSRECLKSSFQQTINKNNQSSQLIHQKQFQNTSQKNSILIANLSRVKRFSVGRLKKENIAKISFSNGVMRYFGLEPKLNQ